MISGAAKQVKLFQGSFFLFHFRERSNKLCPKQSKVQFRLHAAATSLTVDTNGKDPQATTRPNPWDSVKLAFEVIQPDLALAAATVAGLCLSVGATLAFPLAIGRMFDVVKALGPQSLLSGGSSSATFVGLPAMGIQAAPPTFQAALLQLSVCMLLSPLAASAVAYMAPLLAERFGSRLRRRLLQVLRTCCY